MAKGDNRNIGDVTAHGKCASLLTSEETVRIEKKIEGKKKQKKCWELGNNINKI